MEIIFADQVEKFIISLDKSSIAKVLRTIDLLEEFGYQLNLLQSKKIKNNLFELRIRGKQEARIFYTFKNGKIILLRSEEHTSELQSH